MKPKLKHPTPFWPLRRDGCWSVQSWQNGMPLRRMDPPKGSRISVKESETELVLTLPPSGLNGKCVALDHRLSTNPIHNAAMALG